MALSPELREARCRNLVDAAHALVRETGGTGFSMLQLAKHAGVSPATPYNLLGSKSEVLRRMVADEFASFSVRLAALPPLPPFDALLRAVDQVVVHYLAEPAFYRGLFHAVLDTQANELRAIMGAKGQTLWFAMVAAAADDGAIERRLDDLVLTRLLLRTISATVEAWLAEDWEPVRFVAEMTCASRLLLLGLANTTARTRLVDDLGAARAILPAAEPA